jgi:hypothetical protein
LALFEFEFDFGLSGLVGQPNHHIAKMIIFKIYNKGIEIIIICKSIYNLQVDLYHLVLIFVLKKLFRESILFKFIAFEAYFTRIKKLRAKFIHFIIYVYYLIQLLLFFLTHKLDRGLNKEQLTSSFNKKNLDIISYTKNYQT